MAFSLKLNNRRRFMSKPGGLAQGIFSRHGRKDRRSVNLSRLIFRRRFARAAFEPFPTADGSLTGEGAAVASASVNGREADLRVADVTKAGARFTAPLQNRVVPHASEMMRRRSGSTPFAGGTQSVAGMGNAGARFTEPLPEMGGATRDGVGARFTAPLQNRVVPYASEMMRRRSGGPPFSVGTQSVAGMDNAGARFTAPLPEMGHVRARLTAPLQEGLIFHLPAEPRLTSATSPAPTHAAIPGHDLFQGSEAEKMPSAVLGNRQDKSSEGAKPFSVREVANQVYRLLERRLIIERERRGIA